MFYIHSEYLYIEIWAYVYKVVYKVVCVTVSRGPTPICCTKVLYQRNATKSNKKASSQNPDATGGTTRNKHCHPYGETTHGPETCKSGSANCIEAACFVKKSNQCTTWMKNSRHGYGDMDQVLKLSFKEPIHYLQ